MPIKFGKTTKQVDRQTKKVSIVHEYIKCKSIQELIDVEIEKVQKNFNFKITDHRFEMFGLCTEECSNCK